MIKVSDQLISVLKKGGIAVIPTDTLYGVVASVWNKKGVARLYRMRRKKKRKPFIILLGDIGQLERFASSLTLFHKSILKRVWPGKVSAILPCERKEFDYLHLGTASLAFRLPDSRSLIAILKETGPLLAPSANLEGKPPATTIAEAKKYFGDSVDLYVSAGKMRGSPSTLISLEGETIRILREGAVTRKTLARKLPEKIIHK